MAVLLALISALAYGVSDFLGGVFARHVNAWQIAVVGQASAAVCTTGVALAIPSTPSGTELAFGAAAGLATGFGTAFLYRGFARGRIGVVAPVSAVGSALVPVTVGVGQGDRPTVWAAAGIACAFPAIWLIAREIEDTVAGPSGLVDGILAGLGFGGMFALLGQVGDDAGFAPLAAAQVLSVVGVVLTAVAMRERWFPRERSASRALLLGPLGLLASGAFLMATHHGLLSIVAVLSALYPSATVVLAALVLKERIHVWQAIGLGLAAVSVSLVALG